MSTIDHSRFDELVSRYLDASLADSEEHELLQYLSDDPLAARFYEMTRLDTEIAGLLAGSLRDEVMVGLVWSDLGREEAPIPPVRTVVSMPVVFRGKPKKRVGFLLAMAAVVAGVIGVAALHFHNAPVPAAPAAKVASVRGEVYFVVDGGRMPLSEDQALSGAGTVKTVGPNSSAKLSLTGGIEITLLGNTAFSVAAEPGKRRLFLEAGILRAKVAKQPDDAPLIFGTAEATATVRGTELAIIEERSETYLVVLQGAVALRRSSGGPEVLVKAGNYGHVEQEGVFHPWPVDRLPTDLRQRALLED